MGASHSSAELTTSVHALASEGAPEDAAGFEALVDRLLPRAHSVRSEQLFAALQPDDVRHVLAHHPRSLARLIAHCVTAMEEVCAPAAAAATAAAAAAGSASGRRARGSSSSADHAHALNAVRLLSRVLPVVLEGGEDSVFARRRFWEGSGYLPAAPGGGGGGDAWEPLARRLPGGRAQRKRTGRAGGAQAAGEAQ